MFWLILCEAWSGTARRTELALDIAPVISVGICSTGLLDSATGVVSTSECLCFCILQYLWAWHCLQ